MAVREMPAVTVVNIANWLRKQKWRKGETVWPEFKVYTILGAIQLNICAGKAILSQIVRDRNISDVAPGYVPQRSEDESIFKMDATSSI